jgi:hypothetical protein
MLNTLLWEGVGEEILRKCMGIRERTIRDRKE